MTDRSEFVFDTKHDRYPVAVHVFLTDTHGRILLMRRAGSGFADGQLDLPEDALDFLGQACSDARTGQVFREYGWAEMAASHPVHPTL